MVGVGPAVAGNARNTISIEQYIGVPFHDRGRSADGWDCWGLVQIVLREQFGVDVPGYTEAYDTSLDRNTVSGLMETRPGAWREIPLPRALPGDVVLLRVGPRPIHAALVLEPGLMLHVEAGRETCVERYDGIRWKNRVIGIYRHARG